MRSRVAAFVVALAIPLSLSACSQIEDSASSAASSAATQGASKVAGAAKEELRGRICQPVTDGQVSVQDKQVLSGLVSSAESAGLPAEIIEPLRRIAESGDQAPTEAVNVLKQACTSPSPSN